MAQTAYPLPSTPATVARWARMGRLFFPSTVIGLVASNAYGASLSALNVTIGRGTSGTSEAWVHGFSHVLDPADAVLAVPANTPPTQARVDRIVLRLALTAETVALTRLTG